MLENPDDTGPAAEPAIADPQTEPIAEPAAEPFSLFGSDLFGEEIKQDVKGALRERFDFPPFSVLNAREGPWQERKRAWIACGIQSELGRGIENLNMAHPETTSTIDFYAQKRALEAQLGRTLTKDEAADEMRKAGRLKDSRSLNAERKSAIAGELPDAPEGLTWHVGFDDYRIKEGTRRPADAKTFGSGKPGDLAREFKRRDASPGGSARPAMDYSNRERGDGAGKAIRSNTSSSSNAMQYAGGFDNSGAGTSGTSIFDPVLTELCYRWFCPPGGLILDPFAGGSVRGIVAGLLGFRYHGIDLREEQIIANDEQRQAIAPAADITWVVGDSNEELPNAPDADFIFSCPPYGDLERYSDDPLDLSTMSWEQFVELYTSIIKKAVERLKPNRFAAFVVGEYRDPKTGLYRGFVPLTCEAFKLAGAALYNEAVLLTAVGSLPIRVTKQFEHSRKLGKTHQNVIICVKGDPRRAAAAIRGLDESSVPDLPAGALPALPPGPSALDFALQQLQQAGPDLPAPLPLPAAAAPVRQAVAPAGQPLLDIPEPAPAAPRPDALAFALQQPEPAPEVRPILAPPVTNSSLVTISPHTLLSVLEQSGHKVYTKQGRLFVTNASTITDQDREQLKALKDELLVMAESWPEPKPAQSLVQFLGEQHPEVSQTAWVLEDPPDLTGIDEIELDFESDGLAWYAGKRPIGVAVRLPNGKKKYYPWGHIGGGNLDENVMRRWFHEQVKGKKITNAKINFDIHMAYVWGVDFEAQGNSVSDVMHYAALLDDSRKRFNLDILAKDFLGKEKIGLDLDPERMADYEPWEVARRAESDVQLVAELKAVMWPLLNAEDLQRVRQLEDDVIYPVCEMERNAALIDMDALAQFTKDAEQKYYGLIQQISDEAGFNFDDKPDSWQRLFEKYEVPLTLLGSGKPTFKDEVLAGIEQPTIKLARYAAQLDSLRSKIFKPYNELIGSDGLLHYSLNQLMSEEGGTVTGRFSAPYIHQVPNHDNHHDTFGEGEADACDHGCFLYPRRLFIPQSGLYFAGDARQIEYRLFARLAENAKVLQAYKEDPNTNFHKLIYAMMRQFKKDFSYSHQKNLNFMKIYGGGLVKTAVMMGFISKAEGEEIKRMKTQDTSPKLAQAREIESIYHRELPEVKPLLKQASHLAQPHCNEWCNRHDELHRRFSHRGYVKTVLGRRSRFPDGYRLHKALNSIIQGSAADIMKQKLVELYKERKSLGFTMRMTVHDEVCGDIPDEEQARRCEALLNKQSFDLTVPILWQGGTGRNWAEAK